jgi:hypothetical protein
MDPLTEEQRARLEQRARERADSIVVDDETAAAVRVLLSKPASRALIEQRA